MAVINRVILPLMIFAAGLTAVNAQSSEHQYDQDGALSKSQAAIGKSLGHFSFVNSKGHSVNIDGDLDKPLLISLIFTSCHHVCPAITHHLSLAVEKAREALGEDSFSVVTIGFDVENDHPEAMRYFAEQQSIDDPNWAFLSSDQNTIDRLVENMGFVYFPSPRGFDHINQLTLVGNDGVVYRQVYGAAFELPWLMEPLKELVYNKPSNAGHRVSSFIDRIKLFCTVYDPSSGRYRFDYSIFIQIAVGLIALFLVGGWLLVETRRSRLSKQHDNE
jgi:protein SCO1/2